MRNHRPQNIPAVGSSFFVHLFYWKTALWRSQKVESWQRLAPIVFQDFQHIWKCNPQIRFLKSWSSCPTALVYSHHCSKIVRVYSFLAMSELRFPKCPCFSYCVSSIAIVRYVAGTGTPVVTGTVRLQQSPVFTAAPKIHTWNLGTKQKITETHLWHSWVIFFAPFACGFPARKWSGPCVRWPPMPAGRPRRRYSSGRRVGRVVTLEERKKKKKT